MAGRKAAQDRRFPVITLDNPLRRIFEKASKYDAHVEPGQVVADLGCGPGFYTLALARRVGPAGHVYAVDHDERSVRALERKIAREMLANVEAHAASAVDVGFIPDASVDLVVADGLLCCMAPEHHAQAVAEIKRILKADGRAWIVAGRGSPSYVTKEAWQAILDGFAVEHADDGHWWSDRRALVHRAA
jgi:ubiquinone/menaquinone biosynthesis C-methylase UbiE